MKPAASRRSQVVELGGSGSAMRAGDPDARASNAPLYRAAAELPPVSGTESAPPWLYPTVRGVAAVLLATALALSALPLHDARAYMAIPIAVPLLAGSIASAIAWMTDRRTPRVHQKNWIGAVPLNEQSALISFERDGVGGNMLVHDPALVGRGESSGAVVHTAKRHPLFWPAVWGIPGTVFFLLALVDGYAGMLFMVFLYFPLPILPLGVVLVPGSSGVKRWIGPDGCAGIPWEEVREIEASIWGYEVGATKNRTVRFRAARLFGHRHALHAVRLLLVQYGRVHNIRMGGKLMSHRAAQ